MRYPTCALAGTVIALTALMRSLAAFQMPFDRIAQRWVQEITGLGFDAGRLLADARAATACHAT